VTLRALGGNATSRSLVLLDGVPMADPMFGYIPLSAIAPERLGSVRVTRGGGSGAFGAGAVAGTIELTSADADTIGLLSGSALIDDRGETELSGTLAPRLDQGFVQISGRWDRGKGFWTTPASQRVPASVRARYDSWSAVLRLVQPIGEAIELQARGLAFEDRRTLRFAGADTGSEGQDASVRLVARGPWQADVLAYVQKRDFSNVVISATNFRRTLDQRATPSTGWGGKFELRPPLGEAHVLRLGAKTHTARSPASSPPGVRPAGAIATSDCSSRTIGRLATSSLPAGFAPTAGRCATASSPKLIQQASPPPTTVFQTARAGTPAYAAEQSGMRAVACRFAERPTAASGSRRSTNSTGPSQSFR
jgi:outer membrane receptor protein involved in Fe transport